MNCDNCGAAMRLVDARDYYVCDYCATFKFHAEEAGADDITIVGDQEDLRCPVCDVALAVGAAEGRRVFYCRECRGVLATNADFAAIVRQRRATREPSDHTPRAVDPHERKRRVSCPKCAQPMDVHPYYGPGNVIVDTCPECFLIWLDFGELAVIERAPGR